MRSWLFYSASIFFLALPGRCVPIPSRPQPVQVERRSGSATPRFVIYDNTSPQPPSVDKLKGWNVYLLSFYQSDGPQDMALRWQNLPTETRQQIKSDYANAGIQILVSVFGGNDWPTSKPTKTATQIATEVANFVKQYDLDGVDIDYEDDPAFNAGDGSAENWVIAFTKTLRPLLPQGAIMSHAPQAPWFSQASFKGGGYMKIHQAVGDLIDYYNIQYYNQGNEVYGSSTLFSSPVFPGSGVFELISANIPAEKIVIGKPMSTSTPGYLDPTSLNDCIVQAQREHGWNTGVMTWQYQDAQPDYDVVAWIQTVRSSVFPVKRELKRELKRAVSALAARIDA